MELIAKGKFYRDLAKFSNYEKTNLLPVNFYQVESLLFHRVQFVAMRHTQIAQPAIQWQNTIGEISIVN